MSVVNFTPISAMIGGALIGLAAALLWQAFGRIAGVSNILGDVLTEPGSDSVWRIAFLSGLLLSGLGAMLLVPNAVHFELKADAGQLLVAGLLVGFGTGGGCTSGHGVCGYWPSVDPLDRRHALLHWERDANRARAGTAVVSGAVVAFVSGLLFGAGLIVSQMSNPAKVIGFLDITGNWDPSLAFVMAGALTVFGVA